MARAPGLSHAFLAMVRERRGHDLAAWIAAASQRGSAARARFARGRQDDLTAVTAGLTRAWSHGVTAGQGHRVQRMKCQGYGPAVPGSDRASGQRPRQG